MRGADGAERFFDDFAGVYDLVYADHDFDDVGFYVDRARAAEGPVLEAACGTGRVYLELLRAGVDADGFDVSRGMLDELERKAERAGLDPSVRRADMTTFDPRREYALVIVPFRSFLHNLTVADQVAALERFEAALAPDGELVFNVFPPDFGEICNEYDESRESYVSVDGVTFREERVSRFADEVEQVVSFQWLFQRVAPGEDVDADRELDVDLPGAVPSLLVNEFRLSLISKQAFEALFRAAGYDEWAVYGGFDLEPFESTDQEMVWIASP
ncbi:MAG: class I SAM-dependent methyltransferase [Halobacteriales archaeon]